VNAGLSDTGGAIRAAMDPSVIGGAGGIGDQLNKLVNKDFDTSLVVKASGSGSMVADQAAQFDILQNAIAITEKQMDDLRNVTIGAATAISGQLSQAFQQIAMDGANVGDALLNALGGSIQQLASIFGQFIVGAALGMKALQMLDVVGAIAAAVALSAIAAFVSSALAPGGGGGGGAPQTGAAPMQRAVQQAEKKDSGGDIIVITTSPFMSEAHQAKTVAHLIGVAKRQNRLRDGV